MANRQDIARNRASYRILRRSSSALEAERRLVEVWGDLPVVLEKVILIKK